MLTSLFALLALVPLSLASPFSLQRKEVTRQLAPGIELLQQVTASGEKDGPLVVTVLRIDPKVRGVSLKAAFFGESMFSRVTDASKVALAHLVARLRAGGYTLLDTQFVTDHLMSFGAVEVSQRQYHKLLEAALVGEADFAALPMDRPITGAEALAQLSG